MRDYNFFEAYQKKRNLSFNIKSPVFLGLIVIILIIAVSGGLLLHNIMLAASLAAVSEELQTLQQSAEYQEADGFQQEVNYMTEYDQYASAALDRIKQGDILNTEFLSKLSQSIPSSVSLASANLTRASASFQFHVPDRKAAAELLDSMNHSGLFVQTTLVSVTSEQDVPGYSAEISGIIKAGEAE